MAWGAKRNGGGCGTAGLALLIALLALWIAWSAYRRTGGSLDTLVANPLHAAPASTPPAEAEGGGDWRAALDRARERLLSRRDEVQEDRDLEAVQRDIADIRAKLKRAWHGAGEAQEKWRDLDAELERLQGQVREKSDKAKETLDGLVRKMKDAT
jgi:septal ring factor EnvC (AmiA/AmiB activator)